MDYIPIPAKWVRIKASGRVLLVNVADFNPELHEDVADPTQPDPVPEPEPGPSPAKRRRSRDAHPADD